MVKNINKKISGGFTIIETMIAISVFLVVVTIGMGSLLSINVVYQKSQDMRSIMDNLSFILDDISRNARTGHTFNCSPSCDNASTISFTEQGTAVMNPDVISYRFRTKNNGRRVIEKQEGSGGYIPMTIQDIDLDANSSFTVVGALPPTGSPNDKRQPLITIRLSGNITFKNVVTPFSLQTSVSQRLVDI